MFPIAELHSSVIIARGLEEARGATSAETVRLESARQAHSSNCCVEEQSKFWWTKRHKEVTWLPVSGEHTEQANQLTVRDWDGGDSCGFGAG